MGMWWPVAGLRRLGHERLENIPWISLDRSQQSLSRSRWYASSLLPISQCPQIDSEKSCEFWLTQSCARPQSLYRICVNVKFTSWRPLSSNDLTSLPHAFQQSVKICLLHCCS